MQDLHKCNENRWRGLVGKLLAGPAKMVSKNFYPELQYFISGCLQGDCRRVNALGLEVQVLRFDRYFHLLKMIFIEISHCQLLRFYKWIFRAAYYNASKPLNCKFWYFENQTSIHHTCSLNICIFMHLSGLTMRETAFYCWWLVR